MDTIESQIHEPDQMFGDERDWPGPGNCRRVSRFRPPDIRDEVAALVTASFLWICCSSEEPRGRIDYTFAAKTPGKPVPVFPDFEDEPREKINQRSSDSITKSRLVGLGRKNFSRRAAEEIKDILERPLSPEVPATSDFKEIETVDPSFFD